ncbi:uncharacterized protein [Physeter macrocephalus]|uniref:Uncharacterized protein isoform X2 n=1 Tax=Physeter macrocephalus TaxID=9755 RepID=A0A455BFT8_PHYMC|nr:uncharacterized protein LOC114485495 isoform X2 [Physeter catodon]|eukprot:XP_028342816.1 uncharacterized protein LOC114485495 isoform X2 [Physeter catodon]
MQLHPGIFGTRHSVFQDFKTGAPDLIFQMWLLPSTRRPNPSWVPGPERVHGPVRFRAGGGERRTGSECSQGPRFLCSGRSPPYQLIHVPFTFQFLSVCHEKGPCVKIPQASLLLFPFWRKAGQSFISARTMQAHLPGFQLAFTPLKAGRLSSPASLFDDYQIMLAH